MTRRAFNKQRGPKPPIQLTPALTRVFKRGLTASDQEIAAFEPTARHLEIAEAMSCGVMGKFSDIAEAIGCGAAAVGQALKDPIACAWISKTVHDIMPARRGLVDAALLKRCHEGNTSAMQIYYQLYGGLYQKSVHTHAHMTFGDVTKFSDEDLNRIVAAEAARDVSSAPPSAGSVIDVTPEGPSTPTDSAEEDVP